MKDELAKTIKSIKEGEKEEFEKIIDKLNPIITKYVLQFMMVIKKILGKNIYWLYGKLLIKSNT